MLLAPPLTQDTVGIESQNVSTLSSAHVIEGSLGDHSMICLSLTTRIVILSSEMLKSKSVRFEHPGTLWSSRMTDPAKTLSVQLLPAVLGLGWEVRSFSTVWISWKEQRLNYLCIFKFASCSNVICPLDPQVAISHDHVEPQHNAMLNAKSMAKSQSQRAHQHTDLVTPLWG